MSKCFLCGHSLTPWDEPKVNQVCGICRASYKRRDLNKAILKRLSQMEKEHDNRMKKFKVLNGHFEID